MHTHDGLTRVLSRVALTAALFAAGTVTVRPQAQEEKPAEKKPARARSLEGAVDQLGDLDYKTRTDASSVVRRAPAEKAVAVLTKAVESHKDGYVRFRALVLLAGLNDPKSRAVMEAVLADKNDRLREVAYRYFEEHPDPALAPGLIAALEKESSEFVRPPLTRALAAHGADPKVQATLKREVMSGQDYFRSGVIEALGDHKATYALPELLKVAQLEGPLQDDAVLALGRIGDKRALDTFARLQRSASRELQPAIAAAICMLGVNCESHLAFLAETLGFTSKEVGFQPLLRATADSLAELAITDHTEAFQLLLETVIP
ncbi:MAG: HEAT repeat domain-containing protein, partial [Vicinamibacteraceae bacterium]